MLRFIHVGGDYYVAIDKILSFCDGTTYSAKQRIRDAKETGHFLNYTTGKKTRSLLLTTDGLLIASFLGPKTLVKRINGDHLDDDKVKEEQMEDALPPII